MEAVRSFCKNTWSVLQAKKKIVASWDETDAETRSTDQLIWNIKNCLNNQL